MDEQQQQEQQAQQQAEARAQEEADFHRAFAETSGTEPPASTAAPVGAAAEQGGNEAVTQEATEQQQEEATAAAGAEGQPAQQQPATAGEDDPVEFAGFKRSELRRLLGNAAEVDTLKRQLDKAHGSIGDLLRKSQQPAPAAPAAPAPAAAPELPPELKQLEQDYPDVVQLVRHMVAGQQPRQEAPPAEAQQPVATGAAPQEQAGPDPMALEMAVLDRMHTGWREKIGSQEFNLWLNSQGEQVQQEFAEAATADGMGSLLSKYEAWTTARATAADKAAKGQARLKAAVTPSGNAPRPQAAPTEEEEFLAAFQATMGQR
ncbi:hypothetical protein [Delftia acidovorans]